MRKGKPLKGREKEAGADAAPPRNQGGDDDNPGPAAAGAGAAGGMVKPKGQHGKGKLISEDGIISEIEARADGNPKMVKREGKKKLQELKEAASGCEFRKGKK